MSTDRSSAHGPEVVTRRRFIERASVGGIAPGTTGFTMPGAFARALAETASMTRGVGRPEPADGRISYSSLLESRAVALTTITTVLRTQDTRFS